MSNAVFQAVGKTPLGPHATLSAPVAPTPRDILPALPPAGSHARCHTASLRAVLSLLSVPLPVSSVFRSTAPLREIVLCRMHLSCSLVTHSFAAPQAYRALWHLHSLCQPAPFPPPAALQYYITSPLGNQQS